LFASIHVDSLESVLQLVEILDKSPSHRRALVKELVVWEYLPLKGSDPKAPSWALHVPNALAIRLPNLRKVAFMTNNHQPIQYSPSPSEGISYSAQFMNVRSLALSNWSWNDFESFSRFLSLYPSLSILRCAYVNLDKQGVQHEVAELAKVPAVNLSEVVLMECNFAPAVMLFWCSKKTQNPYFLLEEACHCAVLLSGIIVNMQTRVLGATVRFYKRYDISERNWIITCDVNHQLALFAFICSTSD